MYCLLPGMTPGEGRRLYNGTIRLFTVKMCSCAASRNTNLAYNYLGKIVTSRDSASHIPLAVLPGG
jgi:hypothetical protein